MSRFGFVILHIVAFGAQLRIVHSYTNGDGDDVRSSSSYRWVLTLFADTQRERTMRIEDRESDHIKIRTRLNELEQWAESVKQPIIHFS